MSTQPVSIIYITFNAGAHLQRSLISVVDLADEILVVDSGSQDDTLALAEAYGARVLSRPWPGFGAQRQYAVEQARNDWILVIDADEQLRPEGREAIRNALQSTPEAAAFALRRLSFIGERPVRHGDWGKDWVPRLLDRRHGRYDPRDRVHETWHCADPVRRLPGLHLNHYSFASYADMLEKLRRYGQLNGEQLYQRGRVVRPHMPMSHACWSFLRSYLLKGGFLDGLDGSAVAWTTALGSFMKYAIAREMQQAKRR